MKGLEEYINDINSEINYKLPYTHNLVIFTLFLERIFSGLHC